MKLTSRQDIEAPAAFVFDALTDFQAWERAALRRGAEVARTDKLTAKGPGLSWMIKFAYRGKDRRVALRLMELETPSMLGFSGIGATIEAQAGIDLMALAARRTRLSVTVDLQPRTIGARLILQSMRLAKARFNRRFAERVAQFCTEIETRYRKSLGI
ncbi:MAG: SRPBCC family protein [Rhodoferax sp.]|nr:SRPBCC family protein [Pseudorhodobacter sp.]